MSSEAGRFRLTYLATPDVEGFYKEAASLFVCWECESLLRRLSRFRRQACVAQRRLAGIADGRDDVKTLKIGMSRLLRTHKPTYDLTVVSDAEENDNFIDCGPVVDIKIETDDTDDIPLSELHNNYLSDGQRSRGEQVKFGLEKHKRAFHVEKDNHPQCPICLSYIASDNLSAHTSDHYSRHDCLLCEHQSFSSQDMRRHLKMHGVGVAVKKKKGGKQKALQADAGVKSCRNAVSSDQATPYGYPCAECNKYFENKNQRWKHVQRHHREGYGCSTCGKRFAFKNNLNRHEQVHLSPLPREQCPSCHKLVRVDLVKTHARIHLQRERFSCVECAKSFVSRASYDHHLKYTQAHASKDILKYKCNVCDKGYRSRGELRDHVNYQHIGQTQHKCPVCGKVVSSSDFMRGGSDYSVSLAYTSLESERRTRSEEAGHSRGPGPAEWSSVPRSKRALGGRTSSLDKCPRRNDQGLGRARKDVQYSGTVLQLLRARILQLEFPRSQLIDSTPLADKNGQGIKLQALATRRCITRHVRRAHHGVKEGPRDKICQQCGKAFRDKKGLREHEFIHTGERPLSCEVCGCTFRQSASLYTHKKRVHKIYPPRREVAVVGDTPQEGSKSGTVAPSSAD
ncbi:hypothetical protein MSG28_015892 [Choristoneura fumiferana]|uniref:Uncharacterized protein n=1 Tax=Choristoneura fumiferana TaxID=7141 RepID=A0ACC0K4K7_CHOFU|nr:hypothetical protein MSG28_015892 [Choristoneura fumiferana]